MNSYLKLVTSTKDASTEYLGFLTQWIIDNLKIIMTRVKVLRVCFQSRVSTAKNIISLSEKISRILYNNKYRTLCFMGNSSDLHHTDSPNPLNTFVTSVKYILASLLYEQPRTISDSLQNLQI